MNTIYSNIAGVYVYDQEKNLIDELLFDEKNITKKCHGMESNEWLDEELEMIRKHHKDKTYFLGFKNEKIEGVVFTQDIQKLERFCGSAGMPKIRAEIIKITKRKLKNAVAKDWLIIQASSSIEDLNKASNLIAKRIREWYELYNPETSRNVEDHQKFIELILQKSREELLKELHLTEEKSMGADISGEDLEIILNLALQLKSIYEARDREKEYLEGIMGETCPNIKAVAGPLIGAKLITLAGSLKRLSELSASTIQLLGAEKALFRHMKTGAKSPKYGVIFNHQLIQKGNRKNWGKTGRALGDKIAIAAKIDHFKGKFIGDRLLKELEARFG
ncbi:hypothetical protein HYY72_02375 [Candidatus Woesearchaeota archaeon]|nr:hypothetical protein [Candidatus Woesearchaeota archaeon]